MLTTNSMTIFYNWQCIDWFDITAFVFIIFEVSVIGQMFKSFGNFPVNEIFTNSEIINGFIKV